MIKNKKGQLLFLLSSSLILISFYFSKTIYADEPVENMSWQQCLNLATQNNTSIKNSEYDSTSARYNLKASYFKLLPDLNLDASYQKDKNTEFYSWGYKGEIRLPGLSDYYLIKSSKTKLSSSQINKKLTYINTVKEIKEAFITLAFLHKQIELYEKIIKRSLSNKKLSENRYRSGRDAKWTWLQSSLSYEQNLQEYDKIKKDLTIQNAKLLNLIYSSDNHSTGIIRPDLSTVEETIPDKSQVLDRLNEHPKLLLSKYNVEQKEISYHEEMSNYLPDLSLFATYSKHRIHPLSDDDEYWSKSWSIGVSATLKILSSFETYARSESSKELLKSSKLSYEQAVKDLKLDIEEAYIKYDDSLNQLRISQLNLEASSARASTRQKEYEVGLTDYTDWSNAQDQLTTSERALLTAQKNKMIALINLKQIIGE